MAFVFVVASPQYTVTFFDSVEEVSSTFQIWEYELKKINNLSNYDDINIKNTHPFRPSVVL